MKIILIDIQLFDQLVEKYFIFPYYLLTLYRIKQENDIMKAKSRKQRIQELVDYIQNYEAYQALFKEIEEDIRKHLEKERIKRMRLGYRKR